MRSERRIGVDPGIENGTVESEAGALSDRSNILLTQYVQLLETRRSYQKIMIETVFIYLALTGGDYHRHTGH